MLSHLKMYCSSRDSFKVYKSQTFFFYLDLSFVKSVALNVWYRRWKLGDLLTTAGDFVQWGSRGATFNSFCPVQSTKNIFITQCLRFLKSAAEFSRSTCNSKIANLRIKQGERPDWSKILHRPQSFFNQFDLQSLALSIRVLPCYLHIYIGPTAGGQPSCFNDKWYLWFVRLLLVCVSAAPAVTFVPPRTNKWPPGRRRPLQRHHCFGGPCKASHV